MILVLFDSNRYPYGGPPAYLSGGAPSSPMSTPTQILHRDRDKLIPSPIPLNSSQYPSSRPMTPPSMSGANPIAPQSPTAPSPNKHGYPGKSGYPKYEYESPTHKFGGGKYPAAKVPKYNRTSSPSFTGNGTMGPNKMGKGPLPNNGDMYPKYIQFERKFVWINIKVSPWLPWIRGIRQHGYYGKYE